MVLSAIYTRNSEAIYYFSSILGFIGLCIMVYVSTWPNAKIIGKKSLYKGDSKSIELQELNTEKRSEETVVIPHIEENGVNVPQIEEEPVDVPQTKEEPVNVPQTKENVVDVPQTKENVVDVPQTEKEPANVPQTEEKTLQVANSHEVPPTTTISVSVEAPNTEKQ